jgi:hypothetical protein
MSSGIHTCLRQCGGPLQRRDEEGWKTKSVLWPGTSLATRGLSFSNLRPVLSDAYESLGFTWMPSGNSWKCETPAGLPEDTHPSIHREFASAALEHD